MRYAKYMMKYEHCKHFKIKYCDADFKDELKPSALLAYLEEVSCSSADELGFGYAYLKPRGFAFMVTGYHCDFIKPIPLGEVVNIKTWPTPPTHVIFGREYQVYTDTDELLLNATSRWCMVDLKNNKILPSKLLTEQDYTSYNTTKLHPDWRWKIPVFSPEEGVLKFTITIANSEYDHNMHVNNTRYADYCFNCFSIEELAKRQVKSFGISYVKQCKEGDGLRFYRKDLENGEYLVQGLNGDGEKVVQAKITFSE